MVGTSEEDEVGDDCRDCVAVSSSFPVDDAYIGAAAGTRAHERVIEAEMATRFKALWKELAGEYGLRRAVLSQRFFPRVFQDDAEITVAYCDCETCTCGAYNEEE